MDGGSERKDEVKRERGGQKIERKKSGTARTYTGRRGGRDTRDPSLIYNIYRAVTDNGIHAGATSARRY